MERDSGVQKLTGEERGRWRVITQSGSEYVFDLDRRTVERQLGLGASRTINDLERPLREIRACRVGESGHWTMDAPDEPFLEYFWSRTTTIASIEQLESEAADVRVADE